MVVGFVLVRTKPHREHEVFKEISKLKGISEATMLFGEYDIIVKIEARDFNTLGRYVLEKIRRLPGVIETETLPGAVF